MTGNSTWSYDTPVAQAGSNVIANGGGVQLIGYRSILDAKRSMQGNRTPSAEYPDGYLGTIQSRREDKLLDNIKNRLTNRSYQRGVHKGERINPQDYFWTSEVNPQAGLEAEAKGYRWAPQGTAVERLAHMGKSEINSPGMRDSLAKRFEVPNPNSTIDPVRQERLRRLLPSYR